MSGSESGFGKVIYNNWEFSESVARVGELICLVIYNILKFFDPGARVGKLIFNCNLQHLGVRRPWRQGRRTDFVMQFAAFGSSSLMFFAHVLRGVDEPLFHFQTRGG